MTDKNQKEKSLSKNLLVFISSLQKVFSLFLIFIFMILLFPRLFNLTPYAVVSGSMEPSISVGSLVYISKKDFDEISKGDVITFVLNEDLIVATHRVIDIDKKDKTFITKGDANNTNDASPVYFKNLLGVVRYSIPIFGYLVFLLQDKVTIAFLFAIFIILNALERLLSPQEE